MESRHDTLIGYSSIRRHHDGIQIYTMDLCICSYGWKCYYACHNLGKSWLYFPRLALQRGCRTQQVYTSTDCEYTNDEASYGYLSKCPLVKFLIGFASVVNIISNVCQVANNDNTNSILFTSVSKMTGYFVVRIFD